MHPEDVTLVNLTPHPIRIYGPGADDSMPPEVVIEPSGSVARIGCDELGAGMSMAGNSHIVVEYGRIEGLPDPRPGVDYVVSLLIALAAKHRNDLLAPYGEVRNNEGTMIGCRFLQRIR